MLISSLSVLTSRAAVIVELATDNLYTCALMEGYYNLSKKIIIKRVKNKKLNTAREALVVSVVSSIYNNTHGK